jgi:hypothetical protein
VFPTKILYAFLISAMRATCIMEEMETWGASNSLCTLCCCLLTLVWKFVERINKYRSLIGKCI